MEGVGDKVKDVGDERMTMMEQALAHAVAWDDRCFERYLRSRCQLGEELLKLLF